MEYRSVKGYTGVAQLGFLLAFIAVGLMIAGGLQYLIVMQALPSGAPPANLEVAMMSALKKPENAFFAQLSQVTGTFFLFFLPAVLFSLLVNGRSPAWLGFSRNLNVYQVLLGFLIMFTANIMAAPLEDFSKAILVKLPELNMAAKRLEDAYTEQVKLLSNLRGAKDFILALIIVGFFPAMFEEVLFRGALQNLLIKWWKAPFIAILITSLLFSFTHGSMYLFLSRVILSIVLGYVYFETKNIWINIIAHFLNNAIALAQLFSMSANGKTPPPSFESKLEWWYGIIAAAIVFFLFKFLRRYSVKPLRRIEVREQIRLSVETTAAYSKTQRTTFGDQ